MQMKFSSAFGTTVVALALAVAPVTSGGFGFANMAYAKGGNGNGGGNGGGNGNGGSHGSSNSSDGKSSAAQSDDSDGSVGSLKHATHSSKSAATNRKLEKTSSTKVKTAAAGLGSLDSLKRNYHAYMNSKDPKMAAIRAYVMDYAEFELKNGTNAVPTDPALGDEALRSALAQASKTGVVTDKTLAEAKSILGVGPAVGKIDQVRDALEQSTATTTSAN
ncbi:hypothetical protein G6K93_27245 [Agrobacterium rhizogenes]|nr:hypothetical protein DXT98_08495 [Agrobacterium sp. ICMP 7243]NTF52025.1 hypothetical protein [Rhizobium rhizogenes]NTG17569.1 hypothetical protein [Rhizobium rhizogenes]NTG24229.1 hypothetical protein [Rhizobium rhizogenes]NTG31174.1 hypothetical protein [Rhizobium rhizogenes]